MISDYYLAACYCRRCNLFHWSNNNCCHYWPPAVLGRL